MVCWVRLKPRARSSGRASQMGGKNPTTWTITYCLLGCSLAGIGSGAGTPQWNVGAPSMSSPLGQTSVPRELCMHRFQKLKWIFLFTIVRQSNYVSVPLPMKYWENPVCQSQGWERGAPFDPSLPFSKKKKKLSPIVPSLSLSLWHFPPCLCSLLPLSQTCWPPIHTAVQRTSASWRHSQTRHFAG